MTTAKESLFADALRRSLIDALNGRMPRPEEAQAILKAWDAGRDLELSTPNAEWSPDPRSHPDWFGSDPA